MTRRLLQAGAGRNIELGQGAVVDLAGGGKAVIGLERLDRIADARPRISPVLDIETLGRQIAFGHQALAQEDHLPLTSPFSRPRSAIIGQPPAPVICSYMAIAASMAWSDEGVSRAAWLSPAKISVWVASFPSGGLRASELMEPV